MRRFVAAVMTALRGGGMTVVKFQSSRASKEVPAGSADRDAPPAPHADTDAAADGGEASAKRVRVERGIYRQPNGKYAVCFMLDGGRAFAPSATTSS